MLPKNYSTLLQDDPAGGLLSHFFNNAADTSARHLYVQHG